MLSQLVFVLHFFLAVLLVAVILLQKSEGGALGIGGSGSFMSSRGKASALSRTTLILAFLFMGTSVALILLARHETPFPAYIKPEKKAGETFNILPGAPAKDQAPPDQPASDRSAPGAPDASSEMLEKTDDGGASSAPDSSASPSAPSSPSVPMTSPASPADTSPAQEGKGEGAPHVPLTP